MYPFIETIRIVDGKVMNLPYHQARLERTMAHFWPENVEKVGTSVVEEQRLWDYGVYAQNVNKKSPQSNSSVIQLGDVLKNCPTYEGVFKARVVYDGSGVVEVGYVPYHVRTIRRLKLVTGNDIDYTYKSTDRSALVELAAQKGDADEVIIVKNGLLTDTSYSNIALFDGHTWYTPRTPLLKGTMLQSLLDAHKLVEADIAAKDLERFQQVALINAMMPLGVCVTDKIV